MTLVGEESDHSGVIVYDAARTTLTGLDASLIAGISISGVIVDDPIRLAYVASGEPSSPLQTDALNLVRELDGCCQQLRQDLYPGAGLEVGIIFNDSYGERLFQPLTALLGEGKKIHTGADVALTLNKLCTPPDTHNYRPSPLAAAYPESDLSEIVVGKDARLIVYSPEASKLIEPVAEFSNQELDDLWRLKGWKVAMKAEAPLPAGIKAFKPDLFRIYLTNPQFKEVFGPPIIRILQQEIEQFGQVSFRRVVRIPGFNTDPVGISRVITKAEEGLDILIQIYEKTVAAATERATQMAGDSGDNLRTILTGTAATAFMHQYVDTARLKMQEGQLIRENGGGRWPASAFARPRDKKATIIEVCFGWGKEKGVENESSRWVLRFDPEEGDDASPVIESISIVPQNRMNCVMQREDGTIDDDADVLVPPRLHYRQALSPGEIETLAKVVRRAFIQNGMLARIEAGLGIVKGKPQIFVTELLPYDPHEDELDEIRRERRRVLVIETEADLVRALSYLKTQTEEEVFITFNPDIARQRQDVIVDKALALLKEYRLRGILLPPVRVGTAHQLGRMLSAGFKYYPVGSGPFYRGVMRDGSLIELSYQIGGEPEVRRIASGNFVPLLDILGISDNIGAKAVNLAKTAEQGFKIARGGVILPSVLENVLAVNGLTETFRQLKACQDKVIASTLAQQIWEGLKIIPDGLVTEVRGGLKAILGPDFEKVLVLARSVGGLEDGGDLFAGVYDSSQPVRPEELHDAILLVYKSLFAQRAIDYIFDRGFSLAEALSMSVLFQENKKGKYFYLYSSMPWERRIGTVTFGDDPRALAEGIQENREGVETVTFLRETGDIVVNGKVVDNMVKRYPDIWQLIKASETAFRTANFAKGDQRDVAIDAEGALDESGELIVFQRRPMILD